MTGLEPLYIPAILGAAGAGIGGATGGGKGALIGAGAGLLGGTGLGLAGVGPAAIGMGGSASTSGLSGLGTSLGIGGSVGGMVGNMVKPQETPWMQLNKPQVSVPQQPGLMSMLAQLSQRYNGGNYGTV